jgi:hypothetical protein
MQAKHENINSQTVYSSKDGAISYMLIASHSKLTFDTPDSAKMLLNLMRDLLIKSGGAEAKLVSETERNYGRFPGHEWYAAKADEQIWFRGYVVNQMFYGMLASRSVTETIADAKQTAAPAEATRFFDSFKLLTEPDAPAPNTMRMSQMDEADIEIGDSVLKAIERPAVWREFNYATHGFKVSFPGKPQFQTVEPSKSDPGLNYFIWHAGGGQMLCQVVRKTISTDVPAEVAQTVLKTLVAELETDGGKLESDVQMEYQGRPGRQFRVNQDGSIGFGRIFIMGRNIYMLIAWTEGGNVAEKRAARFLNSFAPIDSTAAANKIAVKTSIK